MQALFQKILAIILKLFKRPKIDLNPPNENVVKLSERDAAKLVEIIENPPDPPKALVELLNSHPEDYEIIKGINNEELDKVVEQVNTIIDPNLDTGHQELKAKLEEVSVKLDKVLNKPSSEEHTIMASYKFSDKSKEHLSTCHPDLQRLMNEVIKVIDVTIICGQRNQKDQDEAVRTGASKTPFPQSKHNSTPSMAVDLAMNVPGKGIPWEDMRYFFFMMGVVKAKADSLGIKIRTGLDWNNDNIFDNDGNFVDADHVELIE
jgi:hypothetical protein